MKFAERLKEQRIKHGYNQQYVANYMRVSQVSISNWERGLKEPSYQALIDLSQLFGKSTDYMLGYDEKNEEKSVFLAYVLIFIMIGQREAVTPLF